MAKKLTEDELKKLCPGLAEEVITAAIHYRLHNDLRASVKDHEREMNESRAFWSLTINAHMMTARAALFRAYDKAPDGLNLLRMIEHLGPSLLNNPPDPERKLTRKEFEDDKRSVSDQDPLVKKFIWHRNNLFAHKNLKNVLNGGQSQLQRVLTDAEFKELLDRAVRVLNRYDTYHRNHSWSTRMIGGGDYKQVLMAVKQHLDLHEREIEAEIERYRTKQKREDE